MKKLNKSYIRVSYGEDGDPQVETNCVGLRHRNCALPCWLHWLPDRMTRRAISFQS